jgi:hypothetical protein
VTEPVKVYPAGTIVRIKEPYAELGANNQVTTRTARVVRDDGGEMVEVQLMRTGHVRHLGVWAPLSIKVFRKSILRVMASPYD